METCLICNKKSKFDNKIKAQGYVYAECGSCHGFTLQPRKRAIAKLKDIYKPKYYDWGTPSGLKRIIYSIRLFESYPVWVQRVAKAKGQILDIGAGIPVFVKQMRQAGWKSYAQELSREQGNKIKNEIGEKNVFVGDFEKVKLPNNFFNAVTFWHVLEHVQKPRNTIIKCHRILKNKGYIFAEVPNARSLSWKLFGDRYSLLSVPAHLFYYSRESLENLMTSNGFKVVQFSYPLKYNSAFAFSLIEFLKNKFTVKNQNYWLVIFYLLLPISLLINFIFSFNGYSEIIRVAAKKS